MTYKIEFDESGCMGCGACTSCDNWEMNENRIAQPKKTELEEVGCNQDAADICPANIIKIVEE